MTWKAERLTQFDIPERKVQEHITTNAKQLLNEEQERLIQVREELINMFEGLSPEFQDRAIALWEKAIFMRVDQIQQQLTEGLSDMLEGIAAEQIAELQNAVVEAQTKAEQACEVAVGCYESLHNLVESIDQFFAENIEPIEQLAVENAMDNQLHMNALLTVAQMLGLSVEAVAEKVRQAAISADGDFSKGVPDSNASRNRAANHGGGQKAPTGKQGLGDSNGYVKEQDMSLVEATVAYINRPRYL